MHTVEVSDHRTRRLFLKLPEAIYADDQAWIRPLDKDIESVFDPARNNAHRNGACKRWILIDDSGTPIGRIAAFVDRDRNGSATRRIGGCGFFECPQDLNASEKLFQVAEQWLREQGMLAMEGPVNFGENHMWWGLLTEGFSRPYYGMNYNPPYYEALFRAYGFNSAYEQISNRMEVHKPLPERFDRIAHWVAQRPGYTFRHLTLHQFDNYARDFVEIYNDGWKEFEHFKPIDLLTVRQQFESMRAVMDQRLIWFAYVKDTPAAFLLVLPDANELISGLNGRLDLFGKLQYFWHKMTRRHQRMRAVIMGTRSAYRNQGLESALFIRLRDQVKAMPHYRELELSWVGDFNEKMRSIHRATGSLPSKKHVTLLYRFSN